MINSFYFYITIFFISMTLYYVCFKLNKEKWINRTLKHEELKLKIKLNEYDYNKSLLEASDFETIKQYNSEVKYYEFKIGILNEMLLSVKSRDLENDYVKSVISYSNVDTNCFCVFIGFVATFTVYVITHSF